MAYLAHFFFFFIILFCLYILENCWDLFVPAQRMIHPGLYWLRDGHWDLKPCMEVKISVFWLHYLFTLLSATLANLPVYFMSLLGCPLIVVGNNWVVCKAQSPRCLDLGLFRRMNHVHYGGQGMVQWAVEEGYSLKILSQQRRLVNFVGFFSIFRYLAGHYERERLFSLGNRIQNLEWESDFFWTDSWLGVFSLTDRFLASLQTETKNWWLCWGLWVLDSLVWLSKKTPLKSRKYFQVRSL